MNDFNGLQIPETFQELLEAVRQKHELHPSDKKQIKNRKSFLKPIKKFHEEAGTLTDGVKNKLNTLRKKRDFIFIMCAHQPNFLPYAGVARKIILMEAVKQKLEELCSKPVITYYQFSDETFPDRWLRTAQLPEVISKDGYMELRNSELRKKPCYRLTGYGKYSIRISSIPKPSVEIMQSWKNKIRAWIRNNLKSSKRLAKELGYTDLHEILFKKGKNFIQNTKEFMEIFDESYEQANNFTDLNAFMLSKITNNHWGFDTLFGRYSDCHHLLKDEVTELLHRYDDYFNTLKQAKSKIRKRRITLKLVPFWYQCDCGGSVNLITLDGQKINSFEGKCMNCDRFYEFDASSLSDEFFSRISLRCISFLLVFPRGLNIDLYVGGSGGLNDYYPEAKLIADRLEITLPVIAVWNPQDIYPGLGQIHAFLSSKNSQNNGEKIFRIFNSKYSILDYAMNIGLTQTSSQWFSHLIQSKSLNGDIQMQSIFDGNFTGEFFNFARNLRRM